jgi:hypothetical protein
MVSVGAGHYGAVSTVGGKTVTVKENSEAIASLAEKMDVIAGAVSSLVTAAQTGPVAASKTAGTGSAGHKKGAKAKRLEAIGNAYAKTFLSVPDGTFEDAATAGRAIRATFEDPETGDSLTVSVPFKKSADTSKGERDMWDTSAAPDGLVDIRQ